MGIIDDRIRCRGPVATLGRILASIGRVRVGGGGAFDLHLGIVLFVVRHAGVETVHGGLTTMLVHGDFQSRGPQPRVSRRGPRGVVELQLNIGELPAIFIEDTLKVPWGCVPIPIFIHAFVARGSLLNKTRPSLDVLYLRTARQQAMVVKPDSNMDKVHVASVEGESFATTIPHRELGRLDDLSIQSTDREEVDKLRQPVVAGYFGRHLLVSTEGGIFRKIPDSLDIREERLPEGGSLLRSGKAGDTAFPDGLHPSGPAPDRDTSPVLTGCLRRVRGGSDLNVGGHG